MLDLVTGLCKKIGSDKKCIFVYRILIGFISALIYWCLHKQKSTTSVDNEDKKELFDNI